MGCCWLERLEQSQRRGQGLSLMVQYLRALSNACYRYYHYTRKHDDEAFHFLVFFDIVHKASRLVVPA